MHAQHATAGDISLIKVTPFISDQVQNNTVSCDAALAWHLQRTGYQCDIADSWARGGGCGRVRGGYFLYDVVCIL